VTCAFHGVYFAFFNIAGEEIAIFAVQWVYYYLQISVYYQIMI